MHHLGESNEVQSIRLTLTGHAEKLDYLDDYHDYCDDYHDYRDDYHD